jgi:hypothetical protein
MLRRVLAGPVSFSFFVLFFKPCPIMQTNPFGTAVAMIPTLVPGHTIRK